MNYHNITHSDIANGEGIRVTLWISGCHHHCQGCQNPQTWDPKSGIPFDKSARQELFDELSKDYISGITFSGGDPLADENVEEVLSLVNEIRNSFGTSKTIWLYTGYVARICHTPTELLNTKLWYFKFNDDYNMLGFYRQQIADKIDVLVDGPFIDSQKDLTLHWKGSTNQRVIDVQQSIKKGDIILWK